MMMHLAPQDWSHYQEMKDQEIFEARIKMRISWYNKIVHLDITDDQKKKLLDMLYSPDPELMGLCMTIVNEKLKHDKTRDSCQSPAEKS